MNPFIQNHRQSRGARARAVREIAFPTAFPFVAAGIMNLATRVARYTGCVGIKRLWGFVFGRVELEHLLLARGIAIQMQVAWVSLN